MTRLVAALLLLAAPAAAQDVTVGDLTIDHPVIYAAPPTAKAAAGYMTIRNAGDGADRLVGVEVEGATAEIHRSVMQGEVMVMEPAGAVDVPPGGEAVLAPGGTHVMILGLSDAPAEGDSIEATLVFERAGEVAVSFAVEPRPAAEGGHSGHGGS
jgi:periplasmic copper chaperone A